MASICLLVFTSLYRNRVTEYNLLSHVRKYNRAAMQIKNAVTFLDLHRIMIAL